MTEMNSSKTHIKVSLCFVVKDEEKNLDFSLGRVLETQPPEYIEEILVVDNLSGDQTVAKAQRLLAGSGIPYRVIKNAENHMGKARAMCVDLARSEWIVFLDGDCEPSVNWLAELISGFESAMVSEGDTLLGVMGTHGLRPLNEDMKALESLRHLLQFISPTPQVTGGTKTRYLDHLPTTNSLFRKSILIREGNFSSVWDRVGEDLELGLRLRLRGYIMMGLPAAHVYNQCSLSMRDWCERVFRLGRIQWRVLFFLGFPMRLFRFWWISVITLSWFVVLWHSSFSIFVLLMGAALLIIASWFRRVRTSGLRLLYAAVSTLFYYALGVFVGALDSAMHPPKPEPQKPALAPVNRG